MVREGAFARTREVYLVLQLHAVGMPRVERCELVLEKAECAALRKGACGTPRRHRSSAHIPDVLVLELELVVAPLKSVP